MASIKRDDVKQKWEETEFPLVCETCLGDNPYVRMTKEAHGKACRVCETPFTVFAWQAGTRGRLKKVEICRTCARAKNVCQVCIFDLQYGLPVQVRDRVLAEEGHASVQSSVVPLSDANRSWFTAQQERAIEQGLTPGVANPGTAAALKLRSMARMEPRYERNLPKLCSFFARGECNRGSNCPFRHEMPRDRNDPLSKQNTKDRFYGTNDPVASKMIALSKQRAENRKDKSEAKKGEEGDADDDRAVSTLYMRLVDDDNDNATDNADILTEMNIRDKFYSYGEIVSVRMHAKIGAFVEYTTSKATQLAIDGTHRTDFHGRKLYVNWARQPKRGNNAPQPNRQTAESAHPRPLLAPGTKSGTTMPPLPGGFAPSKPPKEVTDAARAKARPSSSSLLSVPRPGGAGALSVPRPGGGPVRRLGRGMLSAAPKPYYPSADPTRLGTRASASGSG